MKEFDDIESILKRCSSCYNVHTHNPEKRLHTCLDCTWHKWLSQYRHETIDKCIRERRIEPQYSALLEDDARKEQRKKWPKPDDKFY